jgi:hypothetical protein
VSNIVGELSFGPVIAEELNLAKANLEVRVSPRLGRTAGDEVRFRAESDRHALDTFRMAEVRGQDVEANCDIDRRRTVDAWRPYDGETIKRGGLQLHVGSLTAIVPISRLSCIQIFNSLQLSISLIHLISPSIFLPKTPANTWPLPLLIVFK